jgi:hypothetical protein
MLRRSLQSKMMTGLAMEKKFPLNQAGQTWEPARLRQGELRQLSHPILVAQDKGA